MTRYDKQIGVYVGYKFRAGPDVYEVIKKGRNWFGKPSWHCRNINNLQIAQNIMEETIVSFKKIS